MTTTYIEIVKANKKSCINVTDAGGLNVSFALVCFALCTHTQSSPALLAPWHRRRSIRGDDHHILLLLQHQQRLPQPPSPSAAAGPLPLPLLPPPPAVPAGDGGDEPHHGEDDEGDGGPGQNVAEDEEDLLLFGSGWLWLLEEDLFR
jgi:hypothetical protein